ncbi:hypothetical protein GT021_01505 [Streptomyces sp. SID5470]|nr:hypothetical protein [Streptomyces sp. SID5470]
MPGAVPDRAPLSSAQRRLWFLDRLEGAGAAYHVPLAVRLRGAGLDPDALSGALADLVTRHEILRTVYPDVDGTPRQRLLDPGTARPQLPSERAEAHELLQRLAELTGLGVPAGPRHPDPRPPSRPRPRGPRPAAGPAPHSRRRPLPGPPGQRSVDRLPGPVRRPETRLGTAAGAVRRLRRLATAAPARRDPAGPSTHLLAADLGRAARRARAPCRPSPPGPRHPPGRRRPATTGSGAARAAARTRRGNRYHTVHDRPGSARRPADPPRRGHRHSCGHARRGPRRRGTG